MHTFIKCNKWGRYKCKETMRNEDRARIETWCEERCVTVEENVSHPPVSNITSSTLSHLTRTPISTEAGPGCSFARSPTSLKSSHVWIISTGRPAEMAPEITVDPALPVHNSVYSSVCYHED